MNHPSERWGIVGHDWAVDSLERAIRSGRASHAYLLTGPHGIGKTTLARALARRLECTGPNPPCDECRSCIKNRKGVNPDLQVIEGLPPRWDYEKKGAAPPRGTDRERRSLLVEQIRDLEKWLSTGPFESRYKIAVLRRFEEATEEASNAFLKTLEEPPAYAFLILTAQDAGLLLPTIVSRCQEIKLRPLSAETVEQALLARGALAPETAALLARISGGRLGWAITASTSPRVLESRQAAFDSLVTLVQAGRAERLSLADKLAAKSAELPQLFEYWLGWWRDVLLAQSGGAGRMVNVDYAGALEAHARGAPVEAVERALTATRASLRYLGQNANARLVTEVLVLDFPLIEVN